MTTWWYIDGRRARIDGTWEQQLEAIRELRADGHDIRQAKAPKREGPRAYGTASSHIKR